jgi:hypothetical protein
MFIAMNRFRVKRGAEDAFEKVWLSRDLYLERVPGFVEFHLLKGPEAEDNTIRSTPHMRCGRAKPPSRRGPNRRSSALRMRRAGNDTTGPLYLDHPKFEGFEVRQTVTHKAAVA